MEYIVLDLETATEEQLIATINCNNRTSRLMSSEIEKLRKAAAAKQTSKPVIVEQVQSIIEEQPVQKADEDFEDEVEYYYSALKEIPLEQLSEKITEVLPSRKHYQYQRLLLRIKAEIIKNMKELNDFFAEEGITLSEATDFKAELELEHERLRLIDIALQPQAKEKEEENKEPENKMFFVPTLGGDIRILEEIDHIEPEYYERFYGLFESIKNNTFKNVKRFSGNSELAGLCEVKDFKVRVIFTRLSKDTYAVISAFIKKSDNDLAYRTATAKKYIDYQHVEDRLIENLGNEEFENLHHEYEEELFRKLGPSKAKKSAVKKKGSGE